MKRMLITGGTGFLGSRVAEYFKNTYELSVPTRQEMDITDAAAVERTFQAFRPDVVIHCAAMSDTGRCQREPELSWAWNVEGSIPFTFENGKLMLHGANGDLVKE